MLPTWRTVPRTCTQLHTLVCGARRAHQVRCLSTVGGRDASHCAVANRLRLCWLRSHDQTAMPAHTGCSRITMMHTTASAWSDGDNATSSDSYSQHRVGTRSGERVARVIARYTGYSRRGAEELIKGRRVTVNGTVLTSPAVNVDEWKDAVAVDGRRVQPPTSNGKGGKRGAKGAKLYAVHKLPNEIVTRSDPEGRPTLFDRLEAMGLPHNLVSVGRLDFKSEGLILMSTDSRIAGYLEHPSSGIERKYQVRAYGRNLTHRLTERLAEGIRIGNFQYKPIHVKVISKSGGSNYWMEMTLTEGKNQEIRRLLSHFRLEVNRLVRVQYGPYKLGTLPRGSALRVPVSKKLLKAAFGAPPTDSRPGSKGSSQRKPPRKRSLDKAAAGKDRRPDSRTATGQVRS